MILFSVLLQAYVPGMPEGPEGPLHLPTVRDHGLPEGGLLQVQDRYLFVLGSPVLPTYY
jgi:hypothetical protein